jgi:ABC-type multidrug transport system fused ATPase/permease subunit
MTAMVTAALALAIVLTAAAVAVAVWFVRRARTAMEAVREQTEQLAEVVTEIADEAAVTQLESEQLQRSVARLRERSRDRAPG